MTELTKISEVSSLNAPQCLTLDILYQDSVIDILLVCYAPDKLAAYINQCPHTGINLNWQQNECFDFSQRYLACSLHGALFQPEDGLCIYGPCRGQSLVPVTLVIEAGEIFIDVELIGKR